MRGKLNSFEGVSQYPLWICGGHDISLIYCILTMCAEINNSIYVLYIHTYTLIHEKCLHSLHFCSLFWESVGLKNIYSTTSLHRKNNFCSSLSGLGKKRDRNFFNVRNEVYRFLPKMRWKWNLFWLQSPHINAHKN